MRQKNIFQIHAVNKLLKIWVIFVACFLYRSGKQNLCLIRYFEARLWRWPKHLIGAVGQWNPFTIINHVILQNGADGFQATRMRKKLCKWWKKRELLFEKINFFFISVLTYRPSLKRSIGHTFLHVSKLFLHWVM